MPLTLGARTPCKIGGYIVALDGLTVPGVVGGLVTTKPSSSFLQVRQADGVTYALVEEPWPYAQIDPTTHYFEVDLYAQDDCIPSNVTHTLYFPDGSGISGAVTAAMRADQIALGRALQTNELTSTYGWVYVPKKGVSSASVATIAGPAGIPTRIDAWLAGVAYAAGRAVFSQGSTFLAKIAVPAGVRPPADGSETAYWLPLATGGGALLAVAATATSLGTVYLSSPINTAASLDSSLSVSPSQLGGNRGQVDPNFKTLGVPVSVTATTPQTAQTLYTVPNGANLLLAEVAITNITASEVKLTLSVTKAGSTTFYPIYGLACRGLTYLEQPFNMQLVPGDTVSAFASATGLTVSLSGLSQPATRQSRRVLEGAAIPATGGLVTVTGLTDHSLMELIVVNTSVSAYGTLTTNIIDQNGAFVSGSTAGLYILPSAYQVERIALDRPLAPGHQVTLKGATSGLDANNNPAGMFVIATTTAIVDEPLPDVIPHEYVDLAAAQAAAQAAWNTALALPVGSGGEPDATGGPVVPDIMMDFLLASSGNTPSLPGSVGKSLANALNLTITSTSALTTAYWRFVVAAGGATYALYSMVSATSLPGTDTLVTGAGALAIGTPYSALIPGGSFSVTGGATLVGGHTVIVSTTANASASGPTFRFVYGGVINPTNLAACKTIVDGWKAWGGNRVALQLHFPVCLPTYNNASAGHTQNNSWYYKTLMGSTLVGDPADGFYKQLIDYIKSVGLIPVIKCGVAFLQPQVSSLVVDYTGLTFTEWYTEHQAMIQQIVNRFRPHSVIMQPENGTMAGNLAAGGPVLGLTTTDSINNSLTGLTTVAGVNTYINYIMDNTTWTWTGGATLKGSGTPTWQDRTYIDNWVARMDFVSTHIYPLSAGITANFLGILHACKENGKPLVIGEVWPYWSWNNEAAGTATMVYERDVWTFRATTDMPFWTAFMTFARRQNITVVAPFWITKYMWRLGMFDYTPAMSQLDYGVLNTISSQATYFRAKDYADGKAAGQTQTQLDTYLSTYGRLLRPIVTH